MRIGLFESAMRRLTWAVFIDSSVCQKSDETSPMEHELTLIQVGDAGTGAVFSPCRTYRYRWWRRWESGPSMLWVMLNPSTADERIFDPTVTRCRNFTCAFGYAALEIVNLFAFRATQPRELFAVPDPVGPCNDAAIDQAVERNALVMLALGQSRRKKG